LKVHVSKSPIIIISNIIRIIYICLINALFVLKKVQTFLKHTRSLIAPVFSCLLLLVFSYYISNSSLPLNDAELKSLRYYEALTDSLRLHYKGLTERNDVWIDSLLLINTSYDLALTNFYGEGHNIKKGVVPRVNRKNLFHLLKLIRDNDTYKYLLLDIQLDSLSGICYSDDGSFSAEEYDDSLRSILSKMNRVVIAKDDEFSFLDSSFEKKAGSVDYLSTVEVSGFSKMHIGTLPQQSLPLRMYSEIDKGCIHKHAFGIYSDNGTICFSSIVPTFYIRDIKYLDKRSNNMLVYEYQNLGSDILNDYFFDPSTFDNRIIVIGHLFDYDLHETYVGKLPGAVINLNTYLTLKNGQHRIKWWAVLLLSCLYVIISYLVINQGVQEKILQRLSPFARLVASIVGWSVLFHFISLARYISGGSYYNPWIPTIWFSILPYIIRFFKHIYSRHES